MVARQGRHLSNILEKAGWLFPRDRDGSVSQIHGYNALHLSDPEIEFFVIAAPQEEYFFNDPRGAKRSVKRVKRCNRALKELDCTVPDDGVGAEHVAPKQRDAVPDNLFPFREVLTSPAAAFGGGRHD